jgi:hypothetical protein
MRRVADSGGYEFVDQHDRVLARLSQSVLSTGPATYTCTKTDLLDKDGKIVLSWHRPKFRLVDLARFAQEGRRLIDLPDGSLVMFHYHEDWTVRWSVGEIFDESNQVLLTFRWLAENLSRRQMLGPASVGRLKPFGEAVVAPGHRLPVDPILLTTCGFWIYDGLSVGAQMSQGV